MITKIEPPFFELGPKSYKYGQAVVDIAYLADEAAEKYNIRAIFTSPFLVLERIAATTKNLLVFAPYIDDIGIGREGAGGKILPEFVKVVGAKGVQLNHSQKPMSLATLCKLIQRARSLDLYTEVVASSMSEIKAVATLKPDVIIAEPLELIGTTTSADLSYITTAVETIHAIDPDIRVLIGAGINSAEDVYKCISTGADASGAAAGIFNVDDPAKAIDELFSAVRQAWDYRLSKNN